MYINFLKHNKMVKLKSCFVFAIFLVLAAFIANLIYSNKNEIVNSNENEKSEKKKVQKLPEVLIIGSPKCG